MRISDWSSDVCSSDLAGPTVITDPACLDELWRLSGRTMASHVELMPVHPFYRLYWQDGAQFDYSNDDAKLEAQIRAFSPADVDGYRRFLAYAKNVYREGDRKSTRLNSSH